MRPFLLLATRAEDVAADGEYAAFCRYGGLRPDQLHRVRLESRPMPPVDLDAYSGIIVGGGPFSSSEPPERKSPVQRRVEAELSRLLDVIVERDFPFLGACYGVGTLGAHQGAVIDGTFGEPAGPVTIELTPDGATDPLLVGMPARFEAYAGHKEAVRRLPDGAVLLATSAACPVQMFRMKENLYATQFHPELDLEGVLQRIEVYRDFGYFPPGEGDAVEARARSVSVTEPFRILKAFVARYART
ncbi:glutamine amidotransferase [Antribacter sp. KLBMP9083]|uniref:Glutamine amidotransferase n=1 Tax=Antribacter soli TaxID=2910976 RepID=A0AA41QJ35_9MICO|nr:glutamine amidotransferase [Antribacter soli]MCF4123162.1 glutamine amidotransferase [Antribacter soli]